MAYTSGKSSQVRWEFVSLNKIWAFPYTSAYFFSYLSGEFASRPVHFKGLTPSLKQQTRAPCHPPEAAASLTCEQWTCLFPAVSSWIAPVLWLPHVLWKLRETTFCILRTQIILTKIIIIWPGRNTIEKNEWLFWWMTWQRTNQRAVFFLYLIWMKHVFAVNRAVRLSCVFLPSNSLCPNLVFYYVVFISRVFFYTKGLNTVNLHKNAVSFLSPNVVLYYVCCKWVVS